MSNSCLRAESQLGHERMATLCRWFRSDGVYLDGRSALAGLSNGTALRVVILAGLLVAPSFLETWGPWGMVEAVEEVRNRRRPFIRALPSLRPCFTPSNSLTFS